MASPDRNEKQLSRRGEVVDYFKNKHFAVAVSSSIMSVHLSSMYTDRADLLTFDGQLRTVFSSVVIGAVAGCGVELVSKFTTAKTKLSNQETVKGYARIAVAGAIFAVATPPAMGVTGTVDTYLIKPRLTDQTSGEVREKLNEEGRRNDAIRESLHSH